MEAESLGSPAAMELLQHLSPDYWFSAHLHVKFAAVYRHDDGDESGVRVTKFLALDKCLPGRRYLQVP
jgi:lariat debranching enzyme